MSVGRLAGCDRPGGWFLVVAGLPLACLLVGCVGCFQVGWGGVGVLCSGCEVGWLGGFMLVCGLGV